MKIITVVGARPQFIKSSIFSKAIEDYKALTKAKIEEIIIHTGQHYDNKMSDVFFSQLKLIPPKYRLNFGGLEHGAMTGRMLEEIEKILLKESPDYVIVFGDTNSTLAASLAASKLHFKTVHIEAGLRSFDKKMPEEINRIVTDHVSDYRFCPSAHSVNLLKRENITENVFQVGDVMYDLFKYQLTNINQIDIAQFGLRSGSYALCTIHRDFNVDNRQILMGILKSIESIASFIPISLLLHPRLKKALREHSLSLSQNIKALEPQPYHEMMKLALESSFVITDSGGLQKEAYFCNRPCLTIRKETEWVETVESGKNILAGNSYNSIMEAYQKIKSLIDKKNSGGNYPLLYGNGDACLKTIGILAKDL